MALYPQLAEQMARLGANIEITASANLDPETINKIVDYAVKNGTHVTIDAAEYMPAAIDRWATFGGKNVTIRF